MHVVIPEGEGLTLEDITRGGQAFASAGHAVAGGHRGRAVRDGQHAPGARGIYYDLE
jgi:hypothetical protein